MKTPRILILLGLAALPADAASTLLNNLVAYYDFEGSGSAGLENKVVGSTSFDGAKVTTGSFDSSANPSGPGFTGQASFNGGDGISNRGTMLAGAALNLVDARNDAVTIPIGTGAGGLGTSFTVSTWFYLAPGATNISNRYHVFEPAANFDISFGTTSVGGTITGPSPSYTYASYINSAASVNSTALANSAWHQVVQTFSSNGTITTLTVYIDGTALATTPTANTSDIAFTSLYLGRARDGSGDREWDGMLDEVGIWDRALSASEVTELRGLGQAGNSLVPEPSTFGLALSTIAFALWRRRR